MNSDDMKPANQVKKTKALGPTDASHQNNRHGVQCGCGLWRLLPQWAAEGDEFNLVPCPKCGWAPRLRHLGDCVELIDEASMASQPGYEGELPVTPIVKTQAH